MKNAGTANLENAMLDLDLELKPDAILDIKLHQGFGSGAKAVYEDIKPFLTKDQPIHLTGHSLGGAIAVILGMYLQNDGYPVEQIITFGQPKVTNVTGANKFHTLPLTRVVTPDDIVPLVPPISPMQIKDLDIFWHMGEEIILIDKGEFAQTNGVKAMLRATKFATAIPSEKNLRAHKMTTYISLIEQLQTSPKETSYKTEISLFGFSFD
ncbi:MAG: lipase family protein [Marinomonas foliarum]|uniref:lipase family protein n=1 Tax=Marinomonas foliarum TaxID=491950 RepID=UPI003F9C64CB